MDLTDGELLQLWIDAAATETNVAPSGSAMVDAVLDLGARSGRADRHPDWSRPDPSGISPLDAFIETAAEFGALLDTLEPGDWTRRTRVDHATVRDVVEHLVGMERYILGQLGRGAIVEADRREDHWPATRTAAIDVAHLSDADVARQWWQEILAEVHACAGLDPGQLVRYHHLAGGVRALLVSRTFELWAHGDDVRQAIGKPLSLLDDARLTLMVSELMDALPAGMALTGQDLPGRSARFVLEGPGGGTFDAALSFGQSPAATPDVVITTNTIDLCRLAANRLTPEDLPVDISGDRSLLRPVLLAAGAFAAD